MKVRPTSGDVSPDPHATCELLIFVAPDVASPCAAQRFSKSSRSWTSFMLQLKQFRYSQRVPLVSQLQDRQYKQVVAAMMRFAAILIFMSPLLGIRASDLHVADLDRLLQEDWSVIERITAPQAASAHPQAVATVHDAVMVGAPDRGPKRVRYREEYQAATPISSSPSVLTQDDHVKEPLLHRVWRPILVPRSVEPLTVETRERELNRLSSLIRKSLTRSNKERWVAPLSFTNIDAQEYSKLYREYLYRETRARYFWTSDGVTYMLYKPIKVQDGLKALFGLSLRPWVSGWAIWRQETHGEARIWRLLGMMELPSYEVTKRFLEGSTELIPPPYKLPDHFFNDGAHLDEIQREIRPKVSGVESQDGSSGHPIELL